jgi:preprotein translocase SecE subunit
MAVAVKNASETASPGVLDRFGVASLVGALYVYAVLGVCGYGLSFLWWELFQPSFVNYALLGTVRVIAFLALAAFGIRTLTQAGRDGLKAGIFVAFFWILAALALASGIGVALENHGVDAGIGTAVSGGVLAVLLIALGRVVSMPGYEQKMAAFEHQGWFTAAGFKNGQGQRVRRWTIIGVLVVAISGVWTLHSHGTLESGPRDWDLPVPYATLGVVTKVGDADRLPPQAIGELMELPKSEWDSASLPEGTRLYRTKLVAINNALENDFVKIADPGDADYKIGDLVRVKDFQATESKLKDEGKLPPLKGTPTPVQSITYPRLTILPYVALTLPALLVLASVWFAWRMVNVPVFADFLIATEAEMNKVSWTTRKNLVTDTIVVLVTVVLLTTFLFVVDQVWAVVLTRVNVIQTPPPVKVEKNQEVPW